MPQPISTRNDVSNHFRSPRHTVGDWHAMEEFEHAQHGTGPGAHGELGRLRGSDGLTDIEREALAHRSDIVP
ncbi:hypothetical protein [Kineococcus arenarius]|uniref:hypothetical protein n=1 Tax=Kineococcus sp. SYSU DK007 TaxID=3383128 RepID=UPI003D7F04FB